MSFKDIQDLSDQLKFLGCPKSLRPSILYSNYGTLKGFNTVVKIISWLSTRLESGAILDEVVDTEIDRIQLIRSVTEFFLKKYHIKLNPRKLYSGSEISAQELQKLTNLMIMRPYENAIFEDDLITNTQNTDINGKIEDLRRARELSSDLTNRGAILYDLLSKELVNKEKRIQQSTRQMEISFVEKSLKNAIMAVQVKLRTSKSQIESTKTEKNSLISKLHRKKAELDRSKQRLTALKKIRPAYLEGFEQLQEELKILFQIYFRCIRCRDSFRTQMSKRKVLNAPIQALPEKPQDASFIFTAEELIDEDDELEDNNLDVDDNKAIKKYTDDYFDLTDTFSKRPKTGRTVKRNSRNGGNTLGDENGNESLDSSLDSCNTNDELDTREEFYDINILKPAEDINCKLSSLKNDLSDEDF